MAESDIDLYPYRVASREPDAASEGRMEAIRARVALFKREYAACHLLLRRQMTEQLVLDLEGMLEPESGDMEVWWASDA